MNIRDLLNPPRRALRWMVLCWLVASTGNISAAATAPVAVRVVNQTIRGGQSGTVVIQMDASGNENSVSFTLNFNPAQLTFQNAELGAGVTGAFLVKNTTEASIGHIGIAIAMPPNPPQPPQALGTGTLELLRVSFLAGATPGDTDLIFTDDLAVRRVTDLNADPVSATFTAGKVTTSTAPIAVSQTVTTDEDISVPITLAASQPGGGGTLTFAIVANPANGTLSGTPPNVTYTPKANFNGTDSFTFKANDGLADSELATVTVTVNPVNDAPVAVADSYTVNEDNPLVVNVPGVLGNDSDVDLNPITAILVGQPAHGSVVLNPDGSFAYVPALDFNGTDSFTYKANDGLLDSPVATVTITVVAVNDTPTLLPVTDKTVNEGAVLTFTVVASDLDGATQTLTFSLDSGAPAGATINSTSGVFNWTPTEAQGPGVFSITVRVRDNGPTPLEVSQTFTVTVNEVNASPTLAAIPAQAVNEGTALTLTIQATDPDSPANVLTYSLDAGAPAGAAIDPSTGVFTWTPTEAQGPGTFQIPVRATDNGTPALSATQTFTVTVNEVNSEPVLAPISDATIAEGLTLTISAAATDLDVPANTVTYSLSGAPAGMTISSTTGLITWTPTEQQGPGSYSVTVQAIDNGAPPLSAIRIFTVDVSENNSSPVLAPISNQTVDEGKTLSFTATAQDPDIPPAILTFSLEGNVPDGASLNPTTGAFTWTPTEAQGPGSYTMTVRVSDGILSATQALTVTVNEINEAPVMPGIADQAVDEGQTLIVVAGAADRDLPPNKLTFSVTGAPSGASIDANTGVFTWTPTEAQGPSTNRITITVNDNSTPNLTVSQSFTVVVREVNSPPLFGTIPAQSVNEGAPLTFSATATDPDTPPNLITYSLSANAPLGMSINPSTGAITWTPTEEQGPGTYTVAVQATDGGSPPSNASQSVTIQVTEVNVAPVLAPIADQTVRAGNTMTFTVQATDADLPRNNLTFSLGPGAPDGAVINPNTGVFTWTPTLAQGGKTNSITITVSDNGTPNLTASRAFNAAVTPANTTPVLGPLPLQTIAEGNLLTFQVTATDPDIPPNALTYALEPGAPTGLAINPTSGVITWTPTEAQGPSTNQITVRVTDTGVPPANVTGSVTIVVTEVNRPPVLAAITNQVVVAGSTLTFTASATDPDLPANTLTFSLGAGALAGASINPTTGVFALPTSPTQGSSTNQVTIQVTDNGTPALSASQTVTIIIAGINTAPTLAPIPLQTVDELVRFELTPVAADADLPPNILTFSLAPGAPAGMSINPNTGLIGWTPTEAQGPSTNQITVRVTDSGIPGLSASQSFTLVVREVNAAPLLANIPDQSVSINSTLTVTATATDSDLPRNQLLFSLDAGAPAGLTINATNGVMTWTPTTAQGGTTNQVTVRVTDNGVPALSGTTSFRVIVRSAPAQPPTISTITAQTTKENTPAAPIVISINDPDTAVVNLRLSAVSSNPTLVPEANIRFSGEGTNRTVFITPALDQTGTVTITITVEDNTGLKVNALFDLTVVRTIPTFVKQPQNVDALAGSSATFSVVASGSKPISYQWRFNGAIIPGATNSVLTLENVQSSAEGNYSVDVSNSVGSVTSAQARLAVNDRLRITLQPVSQTVLAGANVTFVVAAGGKGPLGYQWRFNGTNIAGANTPSLPLLNVDASKAGEYSAVVTNATGSVTSDTAKLTVNTPVTFAKQPQTQTVVPGTNVTLTVEVVGTPPLFYQWQRDGVNLPGQTNATLNLIQVGPFDSGAYTVVVSNQGGAVTSAAANLSVNVPPTILRQPQSQTNVVGANVTFSVTVSGTEPLSYQWRFKGTPIPGKTEPSLTLIAITPADEGDYSVVVSNAAGSVTSANAALKVNQPVVVTLQPLTQTVVAGASVTFTVAATGTPVLTYQWRFNGVDIPGANQPSYTIAKVRREDAGRYRVRIQNASGPVLSDPAFLTVNSPVTIVTQPLSQTVTNGSTVTFAVVALGTAPISYQWRFNNANITGATGPTYTKANVQPADAGKYNVVVSNVGGPVTSADAELKIIIPPSIQTQPVSQNVAPGTSVTFSVKASGDSPLSYQWQLNGQNIPGATDDSYTISSVQVKDAGTYTVVVQNPGGTVTSDKVALTLILPPLTLGNTPEATTPVETDEGTFDGGDLGSGPGLAVRKATQPSTSSSRWFSWKASKDGIVTFSTVGSNFDTFLAVYTGTTGNLKEIAHDDDRGGFFNSQVSFNALAGITYRINVQGFGGAAGKIVVGFKLNATTLLLPEITTQPQSQTVLAGSAATFAVQATGSSLTYQWLADGAPIPNATSPTFVIQNVQEKDTVKYTVKVTSAGDPNLTVESETALLQIGSPETRDSRAVDKFRNSPSLSSGVQLAARVLAPILNSGGSVARGYSGSQVFNTFGSTKEQGEPNHCDEIGGASQWFTYVAPDNGVLRVSTEGSGFDTVLALYTGPGTDFASLKVAACDNNGGADGKTSVVVLPVKKDTVYFVAVDGVNGASGTVKLGYTFGAGPAISQQPFDQSVALGASVAFFIQTTNALSAVTSTEPLLTYQWYKDSFPLAGETGRALTILNAQLVNVGNYSVVVSNFAGSTTSRVARLTISVPINITDQPDSKSVNVGDSVTFGAAASGTDPISYQWQLNAVDIPGATGPSYTKASVTLLDLGLYTVKVTNPAGTVTSVPAALTINEAPAITAQPQSLSVTAGEKASFNVTATGTGPLTYQWQFKGINIDGATQSTFAIDTTQPIDTGDYSVIVENAAGVVVSAPARLTVRVPLGLTALPETRTVTAGSTTVFSVTANGTGTIQFQWKFNNNPIAGATNANLTLSNIQPSNAGQYKVTATSGTLSVDSPEFNLVVATPPTITDQPLGVNTLPGGTATFSVTATGTAPLTYQWSFNDTIVAGATNSTLTVTNVQPENVGTYAVKVSNDAGSVSSSLAALTIGTPVSDVLVVDGVFQFQLTVPDGKQAVVQFSTDLVQWNDLLPSPLPAGVSLVRDTGAITAELRFYRVNFQ